MPRTEEGGVWQGGEVVRWELVTQRQARAQMQTNRWRVSPEGRPREPRERVAQPATLSRASGILQLEME